MTNSPLLAIDDLTVGLRTSRGIARALSRVTLTAARGEFVGVVGESGCGKTTLALAVLGLLPSNASLHGTVRLDGDDLLALTDRDIRPVRGGRIGYVPQDPLTALDPTFPVGHQIAETIRAHRKISRREARDVALQLMNKVGMPDAERFSREAPHVLSGGMRQRVAIAIALANAPDLIIADEPTTALDATVQQQILGLLAELAAENGTAVVLISHDLTVVSQLCDRVAVLYAGRIVELGPVRTVFDDPRHPYTRALLRSMPSAGVARGGLEVIPGEVPDLVEPGTPCPFAPRCGDHTERCDTDQPLREISAGRAAACHLASDETTEAPAPLTGESRAT
ncbi:MAG: ABC transporter ATP-binding protein [Actinoallomurus sp.]